MSGAFVIEFDGNCAPIKLTSCLPENGLIKESGALKAIQAESAGRPCRSRTEIEFGK